MIDKAVAELLQKAEALAEQREFARALSALGEIDAESLSAEQKASFNLIYAHANLRLGYNQVGNELKSTLAYYRSVNDEKNSAFGTLLYGWMLISTGEFIDAKEALLESYILYKRRDDYKGQAWALSRLASVAHSTGDYDAAIANLEKCIDIYTSHNDHERRRTAAMNLAQVLRAGGRLRRSLQHYTDEESYALDADRKSVCQYFLMRSIPIALSNNLDGAREMLDKAAPYLDEFVRERAIYFQYLGWISNLEGDFDGAVRNLGQGLDIALEIAPESTLVSSIKRHMADACVGLGDFEAARKLSGEALAVAERLNERVEIAACHRVYAKLEAYAGNAEATRDWFKKSLDMYSMIGSRYELAYTRYLAAISGFYHGGERHALLYLAREYFENEQIEHYVAKINQELKETQPAKSRPAHENNVMPTIVCHNPAMVRLVETAKHIAPSNMSVLLTGPTGSGKDLFARFIHHHSGRSGRFVSVNAAAIPENMVESELFGYNRGAFTGAANSTSGWIEEADGGTFYLNEIADSSPELQAKLLDVIENRRIWRLGERREREIDCRIIAATNHDLEKLIDNGRFRLDLYHRLNEIPLDLPALSERSDDIRPLVEYFLKSAGVHITARADRLAVDRLATMLASRSWPGNIRELEIEVRRLTLLSRGSVARMLELSTVNRRSKKDETQLALERAGWNRREAARALGISESTVRHRIKTFNLSPDNES